MQLSVENLQVSYGNIKALHGLSFHIEQGEIVTMIGANGAGKSTTMREMARRVVLLPAPLAPMIQTISPSSISTLMPWRATIFS